MGKLVEDESATQEELRGELRALFQGAIRITLEMVLEESGATLRDPARTA